MYLFRMRGHTIQVHHYKVAYVNTSLDENGKTVSVERFKYVPTKEEADSVAARYDGTVTELDSSAYEWMDGIEVADVPDTYAEAIKIYEMGKEAYEAMVNTPSTEDDLLTMTVDHEYRLTLLELGV